MTTTREFIRRRHDDRPNPALVALHYGALAVGGWYATSTLWYAATTLLDIAARLARLAP